MFQFGTFPTFGYLFTKRSHTSNMRGFPIRTPTDLTPICGSPWLFAAYRVLLRLLTPRHSPYALFSLNYSNSWVFSVHDTSHISIHEAHSTFSSKIFCSRLTPTYTCFQQKDSLYLASAPSAHSLFFLDTLSSRFYSVFNVQSSAITNDFSHCSLPWWAQVDSNHRPHDYQSWTLTNWATRPELQLIIDISIISCFSQFSFLTSVQLLIVLVEVRRLELLTLCLQGRCSTNWATPPLGNEQLTIYNYAIVHLRFLLPFFPRLPWQPTFSLLIINCPSALKTKQRLLSFTPLYFLF